MPGPDPLPAKASARRRPVKFTRHPTSMTPHGRGGTDGRARCLATGSNVPLCLGSICLGSLAFLSPRLPGGGRGPQARAQEDGSRPPPGKRGRGGLMKPALRPSWNGSASGRPGQGRPCGPPRSGRLRRSLSRTPARAMLRQGIRAGTAGGGSGSSGVRLRPEISTIPVSPAKAGVHGARAPSGVMDPGLRRENGGRGVPCGFKRRGTRTEVHVPDPPKLRSSSRKRGPRFTAGAISARDCERPDPRNACTFNKAWVLASARMSGKKGE